MNMFGFHRQIERTRDHLFRAVPFADVHQVNAEIVIGDKRIENMLGLFEELDRLFEALDTLLRTAHKPVSARQLRVKLPEHERRRSIADYLYPEIKILDRPFAVAFLVIAKSH